jgi:hypothetical protein
MGSTFKQGERADVQVPHSELLILVPAILNFKGFMVALAYHVS